MFEAIDFSFDVELELFLRLKSQRALAEILAIENSITETQALAAAANNQSSEFGGYSDLHVDSRMSKQAMIFVSKTQVREQFDRAFQKAMMHVFKVETP